MAILREPLAEVENSLSHIKQLVICDDCNGNNEARAKEKERWNGLTPDQKK